LKPTTNRLGHKIVVTGVDSKLAIFPQFIKSHTGTISNAQKIIKVNYGSNARCEFGSLQCSSRAQF